MKTPKDDFSESGEGPDMEFKVVLIGDGFVGKTSIVNRFYSDYFSRNEPPTIAASYIPITISQDDKSVCLNVWDTAGHEKFHCLVPLYARNADALIVVFDITQKLTFENAKEWYKKTLQDLDKVPICALCANKIDLAPELDITAYKEWAEANNCIFMPTSALNGKNVHNLFTKIAKLLVDIETNRVNGLDVKQADSNGKQEKCAC